MQTINILYSGEDKRRLSYQSEKPCCIKGDNYSTTLHFIFPEGYTQYSKKIVFDVKVPRIVYPDAQGLAVNGQAYQTATMTIAPEQWVAAEHGYTYTGYATLLPNQYISEIFSDPDLLITPASPNGNKHYATIYLRARIRATDIQPTENTYEVTLIADRLPTENVMLDLMIFGKTHLPEGEPELRYVFAEYGLDGNDDVSLPMEITNNGTNHSSFRLVIYDANLSYIESSGPLGIAFLRM